MGQGQINGRYQARARANGDEMADSTPEVCSRIKALEKAVEDQQFWIRMLIALTVIQSFVPVAMLIMVFWGDRNVVIQQQPSDRTEARSIFLDAMKEAKDARQ